MPWWADLLASLVAAILVVWLAVIITLWRTGRGMRGLRDAVRLLPDLVRLISRLARDRELPRGTRIRLWLVFAYLASPLDVIPDFIPVVGYADDVIVVAWGLRSVVRSAGTEALATHWPGTPAGLAVVRRLAGLGSSIE